MFYVCLAEFSCWIFSILILHIWLLGQYLSTLVDICSNPVRSCIPYIIRSGGFEGHDKTYSFCLVFCLVEMVQVLFFFKCNFLRLNGSQVRYFLLFSTPDLRLPNITVCYKSRYDSWDNLWSCSAGTPMALKFFPRCSTTLHTFLREYNLSLSFCTHPSLTRALGIFFSTPSHYIFAQQAALYGDLYDVIVSDVS